MAREDIVAKHFDLVIRGGTVVDGLGSAPVEADVAVKDGRIAAVGKVEGSGAEEIDARGVLVTPGFVDVHTHYDGQATWDSRLAPSSMHGVTTVVAGNCGVGFAPVHAKDHEVLIELMEGIEDIPGTALHDGLEWNWETFGEYLNVLGARSWDIDVCAQLPHAPLRVYVMGDRARRLEDATPEDIARMRELTREAMLAGAIGFSTSRLISHKSIRGDPTPSYKAREDELTGIALGVKDAGRGVLQLISDFKPEEREAEYAMIERIVRASGRPMSISIAQFHDDPDGWREHMGMITRCRAQGLEVRAQVAPRPVGAILGLTASVHPFKGLPAFADVSGKSLEQQVAAMRDPEFRRLVLAQAAVQPSPMTPTRVFPIGDRPDYGRDPEKSVAHSAQREGRHPNEVIYDLLLEQDGKELLFWAILNYATHDYSAIRDMLTDPAALIALGDGGAHVSQVVDASFQTMSLKHWGDELGIAEVVRLQTSATAAAVGLYDRGVIAPGMRADLNVIDLDALSVGRPYLVWDLPSGAKRLMQRADGYRATIVAGTQTYRDGEATGALPGRLVRGAQPAPTARPAMVA
jgi:N-acyl-D-aspartate/D-glutamate deacylase